MKSLLMFVKYHHLLSKCFHKSILETISKWIFLYDTFFSQKLIWRVSRIFPIILFKKCSVSRVSNTFQGCLSAKPWKSILETSYYSLAAWIIIILFQVQQDKVFDISPSDWVLSSFKANSRSFDDFSEQVTVAKLVQYQKENLKSKSFSFDKRISIYWPLLLLYRV